MTRQKWTTESELAWLKKRIPDFQEAQQTHRTGDFYNKVYDDWVEDFKTPAPTADDITAAGSLEAAERKKRKTIEKRLSQWFHNNTRPTTTSSKEGIIPIKKTIKIPAPWQVYLKLYYETKLKSIIDEEYAAYLASVKDGEKPKTRIQIQTDVGRREYEKESDEVKTEVEAYRKSLTDGPEDQSEEQRAQKYQYGVERVQKTLLTYMKTFEQATGWSFCVLAGGPNPQQGGKINRIVYETTPEGDVGLTFEETLGAKEWKSVLGKWNDHLHEVFPENVRKQRSCSTSLTPAPEEGDAKGSSGREGQDDSTKATAEQDNGTSTENEGDGKSSANKTKGQSVSSSASSKSDYEIRKECNIAQNQELFRQVFGNTDIWGNEKDGNKKGKKPNKRKKNPTIPTASSPVDDPTPTAKSPSNDVNSVNVKANTAGADPIEELPREANEDGPVHETGAAIAGTQMDVDKPESAIDRPSSANEAQEGVRPVTTVAPMEVDKLESAINPSSLETSATPQPPVSLATSLNGGTPFLDFASFSAVGYVNDKKNFADLLDMCDAENWRILVENWVLFEQRFGNTGSLLAKPRPAEVAWWMKNGRKLSRSPKIVKLSDFIIAWRQWWMSMQPDWRVQDDAWPPSRDAPPEHHWTKIAHSGPNADGSGDLTEFETALADVLWVLSDIVGSLSNMPAKRAHVDEDDTPHSKRTRIA